MNVHISEQQKQHAQHMERQSKLWSGKPALHSDAIIRELKEDHAERLSKMKTTIRGQTTKTISYYVKEANEAKKRAEKSELDVADLQARVLAQAEQICAMNDIEMTPTLGRKAAVIIIQEVLRGFPDVTWEDLKGVRREKRLVRPRQLCMAAIYDQRKDLSLPIIGRMFHRDHTTVLHAVQKIRAEGK